MNYYKCKDKSVNRISIKEDEILSVTNPYWYVSEVLFSDTKIVVTVEKNNEILRSEPTHTAAGGSRTNKNRGSCTDKNGRPQKTNKHKHKKKTKRSTHETNSRNIT